MDIDKIYGKLGIGVSDIRYRWERYFRFNLFFPPFHADAAEVTPTFSSSHGTIAIGQLFFLRCNYSGVPEPTVQWFHNNSLLTTGNGTIIDSGQGLGSTLLMIAEFECIHKGTYTCQANNSLGSDEASYTVGMSVIMTLYDQYCYSCFLKLCSSYYNMTYQSYCLIYRECVYWTIH